MKLFNKPNMAFYVLVGYVFLSFTWWSYLLVEKNAEAFKSKSELLFQNWKTNNPDDETFLLSTDYVAIKEKYEGQKWMIISEGIVFMILLWVGSIRLFRGLKKELDLNKQQKNFLLSITHELKSPIASAKLVIQTLQKHHELPYEKQKKLLENGIHDMDRLQSLVENLLLAARIEDHSFHVEAQKFNLSDLAHQVFEKAEDNFENSKRFTSSIADNIIMKGDKMGMSVVLNNLIENAVKYSKNDSKISLQLNAENGFIILSVSDEGIGIAEQERSKIFNKFYRIGMEENRTTKGTGLGLFIVKKILELHDAQIQIKTNSPCGSIFEITIPTIAN